MKRFNSPVLFLALTAILSSGTAAAQDPNVRGSSVTSQTILPGVPVAPKPQEDEQAKHEHEQIIKALLLRLDSLDEKTRLEAGVALRELANRSDIPVLVETLKKGNNVDKQLFLIECLGAMKGREALEALRFELQNGEPPAQRASVEALGQIGDDWAIPILLRAMKSPDIEIQKRAASALGRMGSPQAVFGLKSITGQKDLPVSRSIAWASAKAAGKYPADGIDTDMPAGRRVDLNYKGTMYALYYPSYRRRADLKSRLLVCIHDRNLDIDALFEHCVVLAKRNQVGLVVPFFDAMNFPAYPEFNIRGERADKRLLDIVDEVVKHSDIAANEMYLYGEGEGGEFVQRFALAYPGRIGRAVLLGNNYTMPDPNEFFPKGIKPTPLAPDLTFNTLGFAKSDIAILIDEIHGHSEKEATRLYNVMEETAIQHGVSSRVVLRRSLASGARSLLDEVENFIFKKK